MLHYKSVKESEKEEVKKKSSKLDQNGKIFADVENHLCNTDF